MLLNRKLQRSLSFFIVAALMGSFTLSLSMHAQDAASSASSVVQANDKPSLHQALLDLTNPWTVMCVAAHPDDEDGSTLTVLRRKYGVHTVSLFSTYGEGGQNAVGPELYEELGVIRARETMAAAEVQGSEPHFLGLRDFGFSKSAEEAFRVWGESEALRRMVLQIRTLRPDVIITNHDTVSGHGHHQATGRLILQAFDAAADPKQFPEQLTQVSTWQPQRLFVRGFGANQPGTAPQGSPTQPPVQIITTDPNERDPIRGTTYAQQALAALQKHATQGPWPKTISPNGARIVRYGLVRSANGAAPLPSNAKTVLDALRLPETIALKLLPPTIDQKPLTEFVDNRAEVLVALIHARKVGAFTAPADVVKLDPQRFRMMSSRLDQALATAAGVSLSLHANDPVLVPGVGTQITITLTTAGDTDVSVRGLAFSGLASDKPLDTAEKLLPSTDTSRELKVTVPKTAAISVPSAEHLYDGHLFGERIAADAALEIGDAPFSVKAADRIDVAPEVEIKGMEPSPCIETPATALRCLMFTTALENHLKTKFKGFLKVAATYGKHTAETSINLDLEPLEIRKVNPGGFLRIPPMELLGDSASRSGSVSVGIKRADAKEVITERQLPVVYVKAVAVAGLRVAYIPSFDETLARALIGLGVQAKQLSVDDVQKGELTNYDTIIIDNRGYEAHPELIAANDRLLKYVEDGGNLIVFYHKTNEWNPNPARQRPQLAPYPIILSDDRVTEEDAPIKILEPRHPLLNFPNRISQADFANWIQERGLYFPKDWDQHYEALLATSDKGEPPLRGGLLVAGYGKGTYIYTSMVWYRELRAGVPGAYRFFGNMISYGKSNRR
jgi:LmbE family N-acetylglucosaminyl deacetylase